MSIACRNIADFMEEIAPVRLAENWDNVGLLAGSMDREVNRIILCLDVTPEVLKEAVGHRAELIISHHPIIFKGVKRLLTDEPKGRLLNGLLRHDISVYSAHTNLDMAPNGVNDILARRLGLNRAVSYKDCGFPDKDGLRHGLGRVGFLEERQPLDAFILKVKSALEVEHVRVVGNPPGGVHKAAVFCGSFDDDLEPLERHGADVLVTGDVKYHTAVDVLQMGKCVIDAGHFNTEKVVLPELAERLLERFPGLEVFCSGMEKDPFSTY
jgi:dinuclear metal center YbgI/SA1388 family protein